MNKTYTTKRNHSSSSPFHWQSSHTPTVRRKSVPRDHERERSPAQKSPNRLNYKSEFPLQGTLSPSPRMVSPSSPGHASFLSPRPKRAKQGNPHRDLKRKMVFNLHHEIQKPIHTTVLEEISDLERITSICLSTLHSMMENKAHRKYLHHMNNNNSSDLFQYLPHSVTWNTTTNAKNFHYGKGKNQGPRDSSHTFQTK